MKHVGKRAIFGASLEDVKTSCVRTMQGHTYNAWAFSLAFVGHILQNGQGSKIAAEHGVVKAKGSWFTLDTPALTCNHTLPPCIQRWGRRA